MKNNNLKHAYRYCPVCKTKLQKIGKASGRIRYRCPKCKTAHTNKSPRTSSATFSLFLEYLLGYNCLEDFATIHRYSPKHLRKKFAWCWQILPPICPSPNYSYLAIDAKRCGKGVYAIARTNPHVVHYVRGSNENTLLWLQLLAELPKPPQGIVCDGQKGILSAISVLWPTVAIQRCHFHIKRNIRTKLTLHPESEAGKDLAWLMEKLCKVEEYEQMSIFVNIFNLLLEKHHLFLSEKTINKDPLQKKKWWHTHARPRSAYMQIKKLIDDDQIFAFITHRELGLPNTTNCLEGGINAGLNERLGRHRGFTEKHQNCLVEHFLNLKKDVPWRFFGEKYS